MIPNNQCRQICLFNEISGRSCRVSIYGCEDWERVNYNGFHNPSEYPCKDRGGAGQNTSLPDISEHFIDDPRQVE